jgi:hypothetical protein
VEKRKLLSRWPLWALVAALLLKSAMPCLANASAEMQGKTTVEVCTVYGVSMVSLDAGEHGPASDHDRTLGDEHCALTALAAYANVEPTLPAVSPATIARTVPSFAWASSNGRDDCATWVARLKHGPPVLS